MQTSALQRELYIQQVPAGNLCCIQKVMRMLFYTYQRLETFFKDKTELKASCTMSIAQKFAMFIHIVDHGKSNRECQER